MLGRQKGVADHFRDLRDDGIAEASKAVHSLWNAAGYSWRVRPFAVTPLGAHRFMALRRPISARHSRLHVVCFLLCFGRKFVPHTLQAIGAFDVR